MLTQDNLAQAIAAALIPHRALVTRTEGLLIEAHAVTSADSNGDVFRLFEEKPDLTGLPVIEDGRPIGMINRNIFMQSFARPFHREIYWYKSCIAFMDKSPLTVERDTSIQDLSFKVIAGGEKTLADGFIITEQGHAMPASAAPPTCSRRWPTCRPKRVGW